MAASVGHLTIKFNSIKFNSLGLLPYVVWKICIEPKILKIHIFDLEYTDNNKYVVETPEIIIRKLLSKRIEREKCVKASQHAKNMVFDQKYIF